VFCVSYVNERGGVGSSHKQCGGNREYHSLTSHKPHHSKKDGGFESGACGVE